MEIISIDGDIDWIGEKFKNEGRNGKQGCDENGDQ